MSIIFLLALSALNLLLLLYLLRILGNPDRDKAAMQERALLQERLNILLSQLGQLENNLKSEFRQNREEYARFAGKEMENQRDFQDRTFFYLEKITGKVEEKLAGLHEQFRQEQSQLREVVQGSVRNFGETFDRNLAAFNELQREKFGQMEIRQQELMKQTDSRLERIRVTVEEKLEKTLSERLGQSFETVGRQLLEVQKGLGEMQVLAQDVGGLKRVLSNVKMRGGFGEVQLSMLLEQLLSPDQYAANVKTRAHSGELVEFAIKLPGKDESRSVVWLPIDAKFPRDAYEQLQAAYETGDLPQVEAAQRNLEGTIRKMAKDISDKYLDPPHTTDFGIMFLPFEGIYAEVVRKASLLEDLQRQYKVIVTGPTTLGAILNSLQMGFRTLAIQQRSSEVWKVLGAVKQEFGKFGDLLNKAQHNIQTGLNQLDDIMGKRTRAIQRRLSGVESLTEEESRLILPEISEGGGEEE